MGVEVVFVVAGRLDQMVERPLRMREVGGSIPQCPPFTNDHLLTFDKNEYACSSFSSSLLLPIPLGRPHLINSVSLLFGSLLLTIPLDQAC